MAAKTELKQHQVAPTLVRHKTGVKQRSHVVCAFGVHRLNGVVDEQVLKELITVYTKSLNVIWWMGVGISITALVGVAGEQSLEPRNDLETEYGIDDRNNGVISASEQVDRSNTTA